MAEVRSSNLLEPIAVLQKFSLVVSFVRTFLIVLMMSEDGAFSVLYRRRPRKKNMIVKL
jgi:hypothetical protein